MISRMMAIALLSICFSAVKAADTDTSEGGVYINPIFRGLIKAERYDEMVGQNPLVKKQLAEQAAKEKKAKVSAPISKPEVMTPIKPAAPSQLASTVLTGFGTIDTINDLMCVSNNVNQCKDIRLDMVNLPSNYFQKLPEGEKQKQFIQWMTPVAQYIQATTGFPASVMIAQAMIESGSATSYMFTRGHAMFGHTCQGYGSRTTKVIPTTHVSGSGICTIVRASDGRQFLSFDSPESSVVSYIHNLLYDNHNFYNGIRSVVAQARAKDPAGVASWRDIVNNLKGYAEEGTYRRDVTAKIQQYGLDKLDKSSCQSCIQQKINSQPRAKNEKAVS